MIDDLSCPMVQLQGLIPKRVTGYSSPRLSVKARVSARVFAPRQIHLSVRTFHTYIG